MTRVRNRRSAPVPASAPASPAGPLLLGVFVALASGLWFFANSAPGLTFHDSGEFGLAAACGGIPHAPGAPTWSSLATLFVDLTGFADPVRATNILSGIFAAVTLGLLAVLVRSWLLAAHPDRPAWTPIAGAVAAVLVLAGSPAFLEQGLITEQYTLLTALMLAVLLVATRMTTAPPVAGRGAGRIGIGVVIAIGIGSALGTSGAQLRGLPDPGATEPLAWLVLVVPGIVVIVLLGLLLTRRGQAGANVWLATGLGFLWGRACGNHLSQLVLGSIVLWALIEGSGRRPRVFWRLALMAVVGAVVGATVFVWMMLRSRLDPVLDWGDVESWNRLWWALTRQDWVSRPLSEAPPGFLAAWWRSFQLPHQLGWPTLALAAVGFVACLRSGRRWLGWLALAVLPYVAGIYLAHARQDGIGLDYIQQYGVGTWHVPLYLALAVLAGWGTSILVFARPLRSRNRWWSRGLATGLLVVLFLQGAGHRQAASRRGDEAGRHYVDALLSAVPDRALVAVSDSEHAFMLAYARYGQRQRQDTWLVYARPGFGPFFEQGERSGTWSAARQGRFVAELQADRQRNPLRAPELSAAEASSRPLIVDFPREQPAAAAYLLPRGLLFEVTQQPVTLPAVLEAEHRWQQRYGRSLQQPDPDQRQPMRYAWFRVHLHRADYFNLLEAWPEAVTAAEAAVAWMPEQAVARYSLGYALLHRGETSRASRNLRQAIALDPGLTGPRTILAALALDADDRVTARRLLTEELARFPDDPDAGALWRYLQQSGGK